MVAHCLGEHCFANSWRPIEQNGLPRADLAALEELWAPVRQDERHVDGLLRVLVASDVRKADVGLCGQNTLPEGILHLRVVGRAELSVHVQSDLIGRLRIFLQACRPQDILTHELRSLLFRARVRKLVSQLLALTRETRADGVPRPKVLGQHTIAPVQLLLLLLHLLLHLSLILGVGAADVIDYVLARRARGGAERPLLAATTF